MIRARRVLTGVGVAAAVVGVVTLDASMQTAAGSTLLIVAIASVALAEFYGMLQAKGVRTYAGFAVAATAGLLALRAVAGAAWLPAVESRELFLFGLTFACLTPFVIEAARGPGPGDDGPSTEGISRAAATALGLVYITLTASFLLELRLLDGPNDLGLKLCFVLALAVKVGDSSAYFAGRLIGRTPLCWVSPKKTWEGSGASLVGAVGVAALASYFLGLDLRATIGLAVVADLAAQGGDLLESWVKRALGAKDSAATFGEMGGVLDMVDGLLVAAPPAYLWVLLVYPAS